jgi:hypothetical protein
MIGNSFTIPVIQYILAMCAPSFEEEELARLVKQQQEELDWLVKLTPGVEHRHQQREQAMDTK